jgi:peptidoglycan hydrolase CwlO-like protein
MSINRRETFLWTALLVMTAYNSCSVHSLQKRTEEINNSVSDVQSAVGQLDQKLDSIDGTIDEVKSTVDSLE